MGISGIGVTDDVYRAIARSTKPLSAREVATACREAWTPDQVHGALRYLHGAGRIVIGHTTTTGRQRYHYYRLPAEGHDYRPRRAAATPPALRAPAPAREEPSDPRARSCLGYLVRRGSGRSDAIAAKLGFPQAEIERLLERLVAEGTLVHCLVIRPGSPDVIEYRPAYVSERPLNAWRGHQGDDA